MNTRNRFTKSLALVALVAVATILAAGLTRAQQRGRPQTFQVPSDQFPTIQSAINAAASGDKVLVGPGVYEEILTIAKRISLTGSGALGERRTQIVGPRPTEVVPLGRAIGVVSYQPGGGGKIENLLIRGRDADILGVTVDDRFPAALEVKQVIIHQGGREIAGSFSDLTVEQTKVADMLWHGVVLARPKGKILLTESDFELCLGIGFYSLNSEGEILLLNSTFGVNSGGGVVILGNLKPVYVTKCYFYANSYAGIRLKNAKQATICHNLIKLTLPRKLDGKFGDGIAAECSENVIVCQDGTNYALDYLPPAIADNARAGVSSFESHIKLSNVIFDCNPLHLDGENDSIFCSSSINKFSYDDLGGNQCGCDGTNVACQVLSWGLEPPEPVLVQ